MWSKILIWSNNEIHYNLNISSAIIMISSSQVKEFHLHWTAVLWWHSISACSLTVLSAVYCWTAQSWRCPRRTWGNTGIRNAPGSDCPLWSTCYCKPV